MKSKKGKTYTVTKAKKKACAKFSMYIRTRDAWRTTGTFERCKCVTCDREYPLKGARGGLQAGHFIQGRMNSILYDERGVFAQCYGCNVMKKGNMVKFYKFMLKEHGQEVIDELEELGGQTKQMKAFEHIEIFETYKKKLKDLQEKAEMHEDYTEATCMDNWYKKEIYSLKRKYY